MIPPSRRPRRSMTPLLVLGGVAVLAVVVLVVAAVTLQIRRKQDGPPTADLGSALPAGWTPGGGSGAGQAPPLPPGQQPVAPAGQPPPVPLGPAVQPDGADSAGLPPPPEATPGEPMLPSPYEEQEPPNPPPVEDEGSVDVFEPPRLLSMPRAVYPRLAERMEIESTVTLRVRVDRHGRVVGAEVLGAPAGYGLDQEARRVALRARFAPARHNGEAVYGETRLAVRFELQR